MSATQDKDTMLGIIESNNPGGMVKEGKFGALGSIKNIMAVIKKSWNDSVCSAQRALIVGVRETPVDDSLYANGSFPIGSIFVRDLITSEAITGSELYLKTASTTIEKIKTTKNNTYYALRGTLADADTGTNAGSILNGEFAMTPTANRTITLTTAVNIIAAFPEAIVGLTINFRVVNLAAATYTITLGLGTGMSNGGKSSDLTVAPATTATFALRVSSITLQTVVCLRIATA